MGTDDLHKKRKAKGVLEHRRRRGKRAPNAKILIVCEGEKSEPNYFNGLRDHYELNSTNIEVCCAPGSDPLSIVKHAKRCYKQESRSGDPYDRIYCVFDRDSHTTFDQALEEIKHATPRKTFHGIYSDPCFEYWILLHFTDSTKPYRAKSRKSGCQQLIEELQQHYPDYRKGGKGVYKKLYGPLLDTAKINAERALQAAESAEAEGPRTYVHQLVAYLEGMGGS